MSDVRCAIIHPTTIWLQHSAVGLEIYVHIAHFFYGSWLPLGFVIFVYEARPHTLHVVGMCHDETGSLEIGSKNLL
jgi:hypothetical protein